MGDKSTICAGSIIHEKQIDLLGERYLVYLKNVATRLDKEGNPDGTTIRAFIKKI